MKILYLLPDRLYGAAKQVDFLARHLPKDRFDIRVVALDEKTPLRGPGGFAGLDLLAWRELRRLIAAEQPDVLHPWGMPALRAARLAAFGRSRSGSPSVVVTPGTAPFRRGLGGWWDSRLLRRAARGVAGTEAQREALIRAGVAAERVAVIPSAVETAPATADEAEFRAWAGVPPEGRLILCAGRFDRGEAFRDAAWGFDFLRYVYPDLWLVIVGDGPARAQIDRFGHSIAREDYRVRMPGARPDVPAILGLAEVVWVPNPKGGGVNVALEAMAAGRPVVAARTPELAAVIRDGETGFLVEPEDREALAKVTRRLLEDAALRQRIGAAARAYAGRAHTPAALAGRFAAMYESLG